MDNLNTDTLDRLMEEVFYQKDRSHAELRLFPSDVEKLAQRYSVRYEPMDDITCPDGKVWYHVWLLKL